MNLFSLYIYYLLYPALKENDRKSKEDKIVNFVNGRSGVVGSREG